MRNLLLGLGMVLWISLPAVALADEGENETNGEPHRAPTAWGAMKEHFDVDGDGRITWEEYQKVVTGFRFLDRDGDGAITESDVEALPGPAGAFNLPGLTGGGTPGTLPQVFGPFTSHGAGGGFPAPGSGMPFGPGAPFSGMSPFGMGGPGTTPFGLGGPGLSPFGMGAPGMSPLGTGASPFGGLPFGMGGPGMTPFGPQRGANPFGGTPFGSLPLPFGGGAGNPPGQCFPFGASPFGMGTPQGGAAPPIPPFPWSHVAPQEDTSEESDEASAGPPWLAPGGAFSMPGGMDSSAMGVMALARAADANHDMRVSKEEWATFRKGLDVDADGNLTDAARAALTPGPVPSGAEDLLKQFFDRNGNGRIEASDVDAIFGAGDKNGDGALDLQEILPFPMPSGPGGR
ncbi:MAG: EF-hand domain-containing protein [Planctomycetota bacterium]